MELERIAEQDIFRLKPGDHLCCIYAGEQERAGILSQYVKDGLKQGQKVLYIYEDPVKDSVLPSLQIPGSDLAEALARGQVVLVSHNDTRLRWQEFDPNLMIQFLGLEVEKAQAEGFPSLRVSGEMNWAGRGYPGIDLLIEYEAALNQVPFLKSVTILCLYNRFLFASDVLMDVLLTHPKVAVGTSIYNNFYYASPEVFLHNDRATARFEQLLNNLKIRRQVEWDLEQTRSDLSRQVEEQISRLADMNQQLSSEIRQRLGTEYALLQASDALRTSENQFRSLVQSSPVGIMMTDENGLIIEWNTCAQEIYKAPADRVLGRPVWEVRAEYLPEEQQNMAGYQQLKESLQEYYRTGQATWLFQYEDRELIWPDGELRYVQRIRFPIRTERGFMLGSIIRDVTDRRRVELELERYRQHLETMVEQRTAELQHEIRERQLVEEVLRESEGRYRALVNQAPLSILVVQDSCYVFANPAVVHRLGYSSAYEIIGKNTADIVAAESREVFSKRHERIMGGGSIEPVMIAFQCKDGSVYYSETTSVPILYQGRPAVLMIGQDVTERLRYEQQLMASLSEKEVMLREIHHRVKNNLNVIIALIDLQKAARSEPYVTQVFKELQSRIYTMALVHDSIYRSPNLAKIDTAGYIHTLVSYLYSANEPAAGAGVSMPIQFQVDANGILLKIETAIPCGLIINELVTNALKHAFPPGFSNPDPSGCQISISLSRVSALSGRPVRNEPVDNAYVLTVRDNGIGLPAGFNWRATPTLGMQLVQVLSRQLGGQMELNMENGVTWNLTFNERK